MSLFVPPTEKALVTIDCSTRPRRLHVQVVNLDASQTFTGVVYWRTATSQVWASSTLPDLSSIAPLGSASVVLDVEAVSAVQISGSMSGVGGNVEVTWE